MRYACTDNLEKFNADYLRYTTEVCNTCIDHDLSDEYMVIGTSAICKCRTGWSCWDEQRNFQQSFYDMGKVSHGR